MKSSLVQGKPFLIPFILWVVLGGVVILLTDQSALHLTINGFNHAYLDPFFRYLTHLGDGIVGGVVILLGLVYRIRYGAISLLSIAGSGIFTQVLKRQIFSDFKRPSVFFGDASGFHFVEGVELHSSFSFPSGHATSAFAMFLFLSFLSKHTWVKLLCFALALTVAFSRVYISQHYFEDIYVGSMIGVIITMLAFGVFKDKEWGEKGLVELFEQRRT